MAKSRGSTQEIEGLAVHDWRTQAELAEWFGMSARHLQNLEGKGLPNVGARSSKRYPVPHATIWFGQYSAHLVVGDVVDHLPFSVALAEHQLFCAEQDARDAGRLRISSRRR